MLFPFFFWLASAVTTSLAFRGEGFETSSLDQKLRALAALLHLAPLSHDEEGLAPPFQDGIEHEPKQADQHRISLPFGPYLNGAALYYTTAGLCLLQPKDAAGAARPEGNIPSKRKEEIMRSSNRGRRA